MKEQFCNYEISLKLKEELGFNESCICKYNSYGVLKHTIASTNPDIDDEISIFKYDDRLSAPLYQQIIDWFREEHNICIVINCTNWRNGKQFEGYLCKFQTKEMIDRNDYSKYLHLTDLFVTYEEAREKAILKAIDLTK